MLLFHDIRIYLDLRIFVSPSFALFSRDRRGITRCAAIFGGVFALFCSLLHHLSRTIFRGLAPVNRVVYCKILPAWPGWGGVYHKSSLALSIEGTCRTLESSSPLYSLVSHHTNPQVFATVFKFSIEVLVLILLTTMCCGVPSFS